MDPYVSWISWYRNTYTVHTASEYHLPDLLRQSNLWVDPTNNKALLSKKIFCIAHKNVLMELYIGSQILIKGKNQSKFETNPLSDKFNHVQVFIIIFFRTRKYFSVYLNGCSDFITFLLIVVFLSHGTWHYT